MAISVGVLGMYDELGISRSLTFKLIMLTLLLSCSSIDSQRSKLRRLVRTPSMMSVAAMAAGNLTRAIFK